MAWSPRPAVNRLLLVWRFDSFALHHGLQWQLMKLVAVWLMNMSCYAALTKTALQS